MAAAPYHHAAAAGPEARADWIGTVDGVRLRAVAWPREGARGTVLILQGRTEYLEKYGLVAGALGARGFAAAGVDWRGQGLSHRSARDRRSGHVHDFDEFQRDVDALLAHCAALALPRPWHMLAHSMGGLVGLRALHRRTEVARAAFSAPMWGLQLPAHRRAAAWALAGLARASGLGDRAAPGSGHLADPAAAPFEGNLLTGDPEAFARMKRQIAAHPELALGGPSLAWIGAAFREMHVLAREPAPDAACLVLLGTREAVVSADAIHVRVASWPGARLEVIEGARHEVLMERPALREPALDAIAAHLGG